MRKLIVALTEHRVLGYVFAPYYVERESGQEFYTIVDRVLETNINLYPELSEDARQIVRLVDEYNDSNLTKHFSKKKTGTQNFLNNIPDDLFRDHIRPYVERRMNRCLEILSSADIDIYHKIALNNIYESDKIEVSPEPAEAVFNFIKNGEGLRYYLTISNGDNDISLTNKEGIILCNEPCRLIVENTLYQFQDIDGKKLLPFFSKESVSVPPNFETKYLRTFVLNAIKNFRVNATGFDIVDEDITPEPVISLEYDFNNKPVAILKFKYGQGLEYQANKKSELKVLFQENGSAFFFSKINRQYEQENHYISMFLSAGFVNTDGPFFIPLGYKHNEDLYQFINYFNQKNTTLEENGFTIVQRLQERKYYTREFRLDVQVSDDSADWFDIKAYVIFSDFKIPFLQFRDHILNEKREFELPNKEVFILPDEWFSRFREIFTFGHDKDENLQLDKQYFSLIKSELKGIDKSYKDKLIDLTNESIGDEVEIPEGVNVELRSYQYQGLKWMYNLYKNNFGGCLADDMGLGKTIQTLVLIQSVINENIREQVGAPTDVAEGQLTIFDNPEGAKAAKTYPVLIVVPVSLVFNWINETKKFTPSLKVNTYIGANRRNFSRIYKHSDVIITSYGIIRNDLEMLKKYHFLYLVLDESQMIKNPMSKTYKAINQVNSDHRLVLTGTPIENSLVDMWAQINFLNKGLLGNLNFFKSEFVTPIEKQNNEEREYKLKTLIQPFILRRTKKEVAKDLPPITQQQVMCEMTPEQRKIYEEEKSKARNLILENIGKFGAEKSAIMVLQSLTRLRQIANHPIMIDPSYEYESGKYGEILRTINNIVAEGHKALLFSSFVKHLELIEKQLVENEIGYCMLTGETDHRNDIVQKFQEDESIRCFLISLKAGGVGLNLTAADYVFILDPWWNPAAENQAISRAHRIGQDKNVFVYRFIGRDTIEEKILQLKKRKSDLSDVFINNNNPFKAASVDEVMELFA
ncbi:MAG: DEAD/DEAH box helicase family protein [Bacteroidetes bacterium]|jgi:SNF2 family DNA or RNA helicase|nr:DEAD/DEAH box helicase family protein [Bacteroidota bacterium]